MIPPAEPVRRYHLDWLRVIAMLMIFVYHSGRFFTLEDWHVKNAAQYGALDALGAFFAAWGIPLLFVISGASAFYTLGRRTPARFLKDRSLRLLVPLIAGIFTAGAWMVYLERITHGQFAGSFWAFLPHYFEGLYGFGGNFAWMGLHLWYLEMLFIFSLLCLPLLWWLRRGSGAPLLDRLGRLLARPGGAYMLALPVLLSAVSLSPEQPLGMRAWGGWSIVSHLLFFLGGFLIVACEEAQEQIQRMRWASLGAGGALAVALAVLTMPAGDPAFGSGEFALVAALAGLNAWCWILAIWGFARKRLSAGRPALLYANEAVLPFYILHQTVLLSVGYVVVRWAIPDLLKWAVISLAALAVIAALYALIRRFNVLRILFGMKPLARAARPVTTPTRPQMSPR
jgi:glucans biosynthesis protein C